METVETPLDPPLVHTYIHVVLTGVFVASLSLPHIFCDYVYCCFLFLGFCAEETFGQEESYQCRSS